MRFYLLGPTPRRDDKVPLETTDAFPGVVIVDCTACGTRGIMPAVRAGKLPVEILIRDAAYLDDIEQASSSILLSSKCRDAITSAGLNGIQFYDPAGYALKRDTPKLREVLRQARDVFRFQVAHVHGRGGRIAGKSGMTLRKSCDVCGWREWLLPENGYRVDEGQWDGSDFFHVDEGPLFMSERAVQALTSAGLSNFAAVPADEFRPPPNYTQFFTGPENTSRISNDTRT